MWARRSHSACLALYTDAYTWCFSPCLFRSVPGALGPRPCHPSIQQEEAYFGLRHGVSAAHACKDQHTSVAPCITSVCPVEYTLRNFRRWEFMPVEKPPAVIQLCLRQTQQPTVRATQQQQQPTQQASKRQKTSPVLPAEGIALTHATAAQATASTSETQFVCHVLHLARLGNRAPSALKVLMQHDKVCPFECFWALSSQVSLISLSWISFRTFKREREHQSPKGHLLNNGRVSGGEGRPRCDLHWILRTLSHQQLAT